MLLYICTFRSFKNEATLTVFRVLFRSLISNGMFEITIRVLRDHQFQFFSLSLQMRVGASKGIQGPAQRSDRLSRAGVDGRKVFFCLYLTGEILRFEVFSYC